MGKRRPVLVNMNRVHDRSADRNLEGLLSTFGDHAGLEGLLGTMQGLAPRRPGVTALLTHPLAYRYRAADLSETAFWAFHGKPQGNHLDVTHILTGLALKSAFAGWATIRLFFILILLE